MIFIENRDHNPQAVTLEKLPDGTAWLYLRKDAHEVRTEAPEGEQGGTSWECTTALCKLGSDYAEETVESITAAADDWWVYAEAWTTANEAAPSLEERVSVLETLFMRTVMGKEQFYRTMYRMKKITAVGVWEKVDEGELTKAQALRICGPRPKES